MNEIQLDAIQFSGRGEVRGPNDMVEAARRSLSDRAFNDLMNQLDYRPPSAAQLCAAVEQERIDHR